MSSIELEGETWMGHTAPKRGTIQYNGKSSSKKQPYLLFLQDLEAAPDDPVVGVVVVAVLVVAAVAAVVGRGLVVQGAHVSHITL